ncbi:MAG: hypothetical protein O8C61_09075 [Candidatus Methanoperedens sp.]|nr:hypothetical protein [Candidatus Methanoperedens sp.]
MPVFKNSIDCSGQIKQWLAISIVLTMILTYVIGFILKFGLLGSTMAMLSSLVVVWYIMDQYGDYLFKDKKSVPTENEIDSYKKQPFPYHN